MKTFPTLYKKSNTGAIVQWTIACAGPAITVIHGQVGGKLQTGIDIIKEGKNIGRSNETSIEEQADLESLAKWEKQKKKGYVESIQAAKDGEVDALIEGGILPMLAPSKIYPHFAKKLTFPVYVDPKLDGSRLVAIMEDGVCTLWSRTRKRVNSLPHIEAAIEDQFPGATFILDGEAYSHDLKNEFESLMSLIRKDEPGDCHEVIQYWIYDLPSCKENFFLRHEELMKMDFKGPLVRVERSKAADHDAVMYLHERNLEAGFEGSMVRNDGPYEGGKRSNHLQKLKNFVDAEFIVTGTEEGRGKDAGTVGAFVCVTPEGKPFKARLKATYAVRTEMFKTRDKWVGKGLTVMYQNLTSDGIPRFPIGKGFRADG
jgi:DNA ligase-1